MPEKKRGLLTGAASTLVVALLGWGGQQFWSMSAEVHTLKERIEGMQASAKKSSEGKKAQWRLIQESVRELGAVKAELTTIRYVQENILLPVVVPSFNVPDNEGEDEPLQDVPEVNTLRKSLDKLRESDIYGSNSGANKSVDEFQQEQMQIQEQMPIK